jgi:Heterokaryon incompatibility protein (HET)
MGSVYSTARHTIIFLGLSSPQCDLIFQTLQTTVRSIDSASWFNFDKIAFETTVEDDVLTRPWFTRTWVLQELVLSLDPWVQIGSTRVRWDLFCISILSGVRPIWKNNSRNGLLAIHEARSKFRRGREDPLRQKSITEKESAGEYLN